MLEFRVGALVPKLQPGTIIRPLVSSFITTFGSTRGSHLGECEVEGLRFFLTRVGVEWCGAWLFTVYGLRL